MSKLSIEVAHKIASERGGQCLSDVYVNNKEHLKWKCIFGHEWTACLGKIKNSKQWCPYCGGTKKLTIDVPKQVAVERGGRCLSTEYVNSNAPLRWECSELHTWIASLHDVKDGGTWCPWCARVVKLTIEEAHRIALEREGECLSDTYIDSKTHLEWRCKYGHKWTACLNKVKIGNQWCPDCGGTKKLTIEFAKQIAAERGGKCLSQEYVNCEALLQWQCDKSHTAIEALLQWQCDKSHTWMASINNVKNKESWCPECAGVTKWTVEELNAIAIKNGGRLLSTEYINSQTHLEWICCDGHKWSAVPNSIVQGTWCPTCNASRGERIITQWLSANNIEFKAQYRFPGSRYSYDFYIPSTGWLIEFDGLQHFREVPFFHNKVSFERRQEIDREKTQMVYSNGLSLFRIHCYDIVKIPDLLPLILIRTPPHIACSRVENYEYLNLDFSHKPKPNHSPSMIPHSALLNAKPLTLVVLKQ